MGTSGKWKGYKMANIKTKGSSFYKAKYHPNQLATILKDLITEFNLNKSEIIATLEGWSNKEG